MVVGNRACFRLDSVGDFDRDNFDEVSGPVSSIVRFLVTLSILLDSSSEAALKSSSDDAMKSSSKSAMAIWRSCNPDSENGSGGNIPVCFGLLAM
jgi:hypothetical protein